MTGGGESPLPKIILTLCHVKNKMRISILVGVLVAAFVASFLHHKNRGENE